MKLWTLYYLHPAVHMLYALHSVNSGDTFTPKLSCDIVGTWEYAGCTHLYFFFFFYFEAVWKGCRGRTTLPYLSLTWLYDLVIMSSESAHFWRKPQELMCSIWHLLLSYIQLKWLISCVLVLTFSFCLFCFYFFYNWFLWFWICSLYLCLLLSMLLLTYQCSSALI